MSPNSDFDFFNDNDFLNKKKLKNMDIFKQTNWLRGFVDSLALSDSISKRQIESLREKLDLLITSIENQYEEEDDDEGWEQASKYVEQKKSTLKNIDEDISGDDDLPF